MGTKHYKQQISAYVDQELTKEDRQTVAEHLINCEACRREHDRVKLGVGLAVKLQQADAPDGVWRSIESDLNGERTPRLAAFESPRWFDLRHVGAFATAILVVGFLSVLVYRGLFMGTDANLAQAQVEEPSHFSSPTSVVIEGRADPAPVSNTNPANANHSNTTTSTAGLSQPSGASWAVESLVGKASVAKIAVGESLETDASSRVRIDVADIGKVEIAPNSRVKLVGTSDKQHRLSLERGSLYAKIAAPPRLFIVDTPSGQAVDLGCEYTLEVDNSGNSKLNVISGFVALELGGRESIVPGGAACITRKGKGIGTPFSSVVSPEFEQALYRFDFERGGSRAVKQMIDHAEPYDIVTLWHLLSRVSPKDRPAVYASLAKFVPPPEGVSFDGVLSLNKPMLETWRSAVESAWSK